MNGAAVSWRTAKQSVVARSSTESEYIAASEASQEAIWMKEFITELGVVPSALDRTKVTQEAEAHQATFSRYSRACPRW